ncbi:preprotein translocase subunit SecE [Nitratidesulfovibrio vulgaris]|jgi:preprotein translocase subunit SecE|uniref:Protein translocase subunit SecE n=2 Tax=Nitratidesulfovibrio vulgaris TaxID=881 RepID=Q727D3_NITV2|nr:preprotein translocase subunit SecE [Nitratidesulfovibrio vulgaris]GEB79534.1 protein translocase subunit SecE [Desulfovibrio desulfuricans]HBW16410.1 preprotein translocase subunit SecE [Desulfovibrio sp.]AAS97394.1 preprotein translocase, SecE subunit [Nitratidesulfovibrio vulgaris str. Hildenborough]ABM27468.1 protein translocase subunit secE/sec61 gamma [Nitratidesulfovibrio vulgaris DP4]ADP87840.1 preprotein translocase, SecE subunit [Nitratidesulfovibrio vulgaris RCH1]
MAKKQSNAPEAASASSGTSLGDKVTQFRDYVEEAKVELRKVSWPTRKEAWATSMTVLVFVFVMSLFLGFVDLGLTHLIEFILS